MATLTSVRAAPPEGDDSALTDRARRTARLDELRAAGLVRLATGPDSRSTPRPNARSSPVAPAEIHPSIASPAPGPEGRGAEGRGAEGGGAEDRGAEDRGAEDRGAGGSFGWPDRGAETSLVVAAALRPLLPTGSLRRGTTVALVTPTATPTVTSSIAPSVASVSGPVGSGRPAGVGSTSLLYALLAEASTAGSWCAVVGLPQLGLVAAAEAGVAIERLALVPHPGPEWAAVVAALLDGVDVVVTAVPGPVPAQLASRLTARARQRGAVLMPVGGRWPGADLALEVVGSAWHGLEHGSGRLRRHEVEVMAVGRGSAARPRRTRLWLAGGAPPAAPFAAPPTAAPARVPLRLAG